MKIQTTDEQIIYDDKELLKGLSLTGESNFFFRMRGHIGLFVLGSILGAYSFLGMMYFFQSKRNVIMPVLILLTLFNFVNTVYVLRPKTVFRQIVGSPPKEDVYRPDSLAAYQ